MKYITTNKSFNQTQVVLGQSTYNLQIVTKPKQKRKIRKITWQNQNTVED